MVLERLRDNWKQKDIDKLQKELGGISYQQEEYQLGEILAKLAFEKLKMQECKWQELKPLYIQPPPMG